MRVLQFTSSVVVLYVPGIYLQINKHIHMHITLVKYKIYLQISF